MMELKKIYTAHFPKKGFKALTIFPFVFVRKDMRDKYVDATERHEKTHALQQIEMLWLLFFVWYGLEYIIKIVICKFDSDRAYFSISFEQEAYAGQNKFSYNDTRKHYAWIKYLFTLKQKKI